MFTAFRPDRIIKYEKISLDWIRVNTLSFLWTDESKFKIFEFKDGFIFTR